MLKDIIKIQNHEIVRTGIIAGAGLLGNYFSNIRNDITPKFLPQNPTSFNVPYVMPYRNPPSRTKRKQKKRKYGKRKSFQKQVLALAGAKHWTVSLNPSTLHNNMYVFSPTIGVLTGTTNTTRNGDEIFLAALKIHASFCSATAAGAYQYRIICGFSTTQDTTALVNSAMPVSTQMTAMFLPNSGSNLLTTAIINPKTFTVLDDRIVDSNSQISGAADITAVNYTVSINQKYVYFGSTSAYGKVKTLYVILIPIVVGGTNNSTATGQHFISTDLIFKDY